MEPAHDFPLSGLKVIELASYVAAPAAGRILCSFGADVIKIEPPGGDALRKSGITEGIICNDDTNPLFTIFNSGKKFVSLNLKTQAGLNALMDLLASADVLITNILQPALEELKLDYENLKARFPRLIYAHFSAYGNRGPDCFKPGFDLTAFWLRNGPMSDWMNNSSVPFTPSFGFGDLASGSAFLSGILIAIIGRNKTGRGCYFCSSLEANGVWCNSVPVLSHEVLLSRVAEAKISALKDPFCDYYICSDNIYIGVYNNEYTKDLKKFSLVLGLEDIICDSRFASLEALHKSGQYVPLVERLRGIFSGKSSEQWLQYLGSNHISCEKVYSFSQVSEDPQAIANGYLEEVCFRSGLKALMPCPPLEYSSFSKRTYIPAGVCGCDNAEVFSSLGYSADKIRELG